MACVCSGMTNSAAAAQAGEADLAAAALSPACKAGQEVARELLLQGCRLSCTQWQPGNVLTCAAWTLIAACLPDQGQALDQSLQEVDVENLSLVLHGLQRCVSQAPKSPALWPDTLLWWYLVLSAKVCLCTTIAISFSFRSLLYLVCPDVKLHLRLISSL